MNGENTQVLEYLNLPLNPKGMYGFFSTSDIIPQVPSECSEESIKSSPQTELL